MAGSIHLSVSILTLISAVLAIEGCALAPSAGEARQEREAALLGRQLGGAPLPGSGAQLRAYAQFAASRHPDVRAAFLDWKAAVDSIALERALPDPQLTFQADLARELTSLMPGVMADLMSPGKRAAMTREAESASSSAYRAYRSKVAEIASNVRRSWIELAFLGEELALNERESEAVAEALGLARASYASGGAMGSIDAQVQLSSRASRAASERDVLLLRQTAARARFKASLGLGATDPDPAWPQPALERSAIPDEEGLWKAVERSDPELARMRTMVEMAEAEVEVSRKTGAADLSLGAMADFKADPFLVRPLAALTLPLYREKVAKTVEAARARRDAAAARVDARLVEAAALLAEALGMIRQSDRMIDEIDHHTLPFIDESGTAAAVAYGAGSGDPSMIAQARLMRVGMLQDRASALRDRELAAVDLELLCAGATEPVADSLP